MAGDFNTNLSSASLDKSYLEDLIHSLDLFIVPFQPTYHISIQALALISSLKLLCFSQIPAPFLSNHDLILISYNIPTPKQNSLRVLSSLTTEILNPFVDSLSQSLDLIYSSYSIDEMFEVFSSNLLKFLNDRAPLPPDVLLPHGLIKRSEG